MPSIGILSAPYFNSSPISETIIYSTPNPPAQNHPPARSLPPSLPSILYLSPISESRNSQTENNITEPKPPEQNNPQVVMDNTNTLTLRVIKLT